MMNDSPENTGNDDGGQEVESLKVSASGGKTYHEIIRDTDKVIDKHADNYIKQLEKDIKALKKLAPKYEKDPTEANLNPLFALVHNMRGQGTLFGYPLVTSVGGQFCRYIDGLPEGISPRKDVSMLFIKTLEIIQHDDVKGTDNAKFKELSSAMLSMVDFLLRKASK